MYKPRRMELACTGRILPFDVSLMGIEKDRLEFDAFCAQLNVLCPQVACCAAITDHD